MAYAIIPVYWVKNMISIYCGYKQGCYWLALRNCVSQMFFSLNHLLSGRGGPIFHKKYQFFPTNHKTMVS